MPKKITISVIMPGKGNKIILNKFYDEPSPFECDTVQQFYDSKVKTAVNELGGAGPLYKVAVVPRGGESLGLSRPSFTCMAALALSISL